MQVPDKLYLESPQNSVQTETTQKRNIMKLDCLRVKRAITCVSAYLPRIAPLFKFQEYLQFSTCK